MPVLLAGDIGGTKTILRVVDSTASGAGGELPEQSLLKQTPFRSEDFPDLVPMVRRFLQEASRETGRSLKPSAACFGLAGPVHENASKLTNLAWSLQGERLERQLEIPRVELINDFAAIGYGVLGLKDEDFMVLQEGEFDPAAPVAVIGAGTGLGQGFLIPDAGGRHWPFASEGGHVDFAPRSEIEFDLLKYLQESGNLTHVSAERVVSGMGISSIYQFLRDRNPSMESPTMADAFRTWKQEIATGEEERTVDLPARIAQAAASEQDFLCRRTMRIFVEAYGAAAGNLALKLLPYGGLFVAGGIAPKILGLLTDGDAFMEPMRDKGRMRPLMERVPVKVVLNSKVGLIGAALHAARLAD